MCRNMGQAQGADHSEVKDEYNKKATPGKGVITQDDDLQIKKHKQEIEFAEWLKSTYGGDIHIYQEHSGAKNPDYIWNGKMWDLKTVSTEKAANSAIKEGQKQIRNNPGGIILNYNKNDLSIPVLESVINNRMKWYKDIELDIMIVNNGKTVKILRYKK